MKSTKSFPINYSERTLTCVWCLNGPSDHPLACRWTLGHQAGKRSEGAACARLQNNEQIA